MRKMLDESWSDYTYYRDRGWFESDYFYPVKLDPFKKLAVTMALRSRRFDRYVLDFLSENPGGTVINIGCGLDTRFYRVDNGRVL